MSRKFRYKSNFCYLAILLDILFIYCANNIYFKIILLLAGVISFIYFLNAKGAFELPEDEEKLEISGFFWTHNLSYENVMKVCVEEIYRKIFTGIYYKDRITKNPSPDRN